MEEEFQILHPRPSSIVAALYTMRDLGVDVVILHGPIGVIGTCASMIIGEDMQSIVAQAKIDIPTLVVDVHAGYSDNTVGVIRTLEAAEKEGIISSEELSHQKHILEAATRVEKEHGAASKDYLPPERGDTKYGVARRLIELIDCGSSGLNIMNAKKETAYTFIDMNLAVSEIAKADQIRTMANLNPNIGLPRVRQYANEILRDLKARGFRIDHCIGGLDEYGVAGKVASRLIKERYADYDFA
ncbi:Ni-sirohydrochlorin a,c-diamide reductive cyclase catalytic subunit, partial [Methanosarcinales archaeon ex4484_138]